MKRGVDFGCPQLTQRSNNCLLEIISENWRVAESPVSFECRCTQIVQLQDISGEKVPTWLVLGEVVAVHIAQVMLKDGIYDTASAGHILRGGGPADYFSIELEQLFQMPRPA